jgi:hypothetical protein
LRAQAQRQKRIWLLTAWVGSMAHQWQFSTMMALPAALISLLIATMSVSPPQPSSFHASNPKSISALTSPLICFSHSGESTPPGLSQ